jgi:hypothetical protein
MSQPPNAQQSPAADALEPSECWAFLREARVGRLALVDQGRPEIFPVSFLVDHGAIAFRTGPGRKLSIISSQQPADVVAFEADGVDDGIAWSVVVKGRAREITGLYDAIDSARLPLYPSQGGPKGHLIKVTPAEVTGRRFPVVDETRWTTQVTGSRAAAAE